MSLLHICILFVVVPDSAFPLGFSSVALFLRGGFMGVN